MYGKPIEEMTVGELAAYLRKLDQMSGAKDPNDTKKNIRLELIRRGQLSEATGLPMEVLLRNPLIRAEIEQVEAERAEDPKEEV